MQGGVSQQHCVTSTLLCISSMHAADSTARHKEKGHITLSSAAAALRSSIFFCRASAAASSVLISPSSFSSSLASVRPCDHPVRCQCLQADPT